MRDGVSDIGFLHISHAWRFTTSRQQYISLHIARCKSFRHFIRRALRAAFRITRFSPKDAHLSATARYMARRHTAAGAAAADTGALRRAEGCRWAAIFAIRAKLLRALEELDYRAYLILISLI